MDGDLDLERLDEEALSADMPSLSSCGNLIESEEAFIEVDCDKPVEPESPKRKPKPS